MLPMVTIHLDIFRQKTRQRKSATFEERPQILMEVAERGKEQEEISRSPQDKLGFHSRSAGEPELVPPSQR